VVVDAAQKVTLRKATAAEVLPFVVSAARFDTTGGTQSAAHLARHGGYLVMEGARAIAGFTVVERDGGVFVTAASGFGRRDLTALILGLLERIGAAHVGFQTRRPGLIRKAARRGYQVAGQVQQGVIMRKTIQ
jgi:hypothetical protein